MSFLRTRTRGTTPNPLLPHQEGNNNQNDEANKGNQKSFIQRNKAPLITMITLVLFLHTCTSIFTTHTLSLNIIKEIPALMSIKKKTEDMAAPMGEIIYGAKSKGDDTAKLVTQAIQTGFRHIATGGFHSEYNEPGVGVGWKASGVPRNKLFLQTLFVAQTVNGYGAQNCIFSEQECPPASTLSIEDQVHLSIQSSLHNLQTNYIDAVLIRNFRAKVQPYEETLRVWRVLEDYVDRGIVRHLGIVSVHNKEYIQNLYDAARVKPTIIQNRFHGNRGYDIELRPLFQELGMANQLFWVLTGSAGGRVRNEVVVKMAEKKGVSPQNILYALTMAIGGSPLIGTKSLEHMREDVDALLVRGVTLEGEDLVAVAGTVNKNLVVVAANNNVAE